MGRGDWTPLSISLTLSILLAVVQALSVLATGSEAHSPFWVGVVTLVVPVVSVTSHVWYVRRYSTDRRRGLLFRYAGLGSLLGGLLYAASGAAVTIQQRAVGVPISNADVLLLELWLGGSLIGLAVGHLYGTIDAERARATSLLDATEGLVGETDTTSIAESTVTATAESLGFDESVFYLVRDETTLEPLATADTDGTLLDRAPSPDSRGELALSAYESRDTVFREDGRSNPDSHTSDSPGRSEMFVPVGDLGILVAVSRETDAFDETDRALVQQLASTAEAVLERATNGTTPREREQKLERLQSRSRRLMNTKTRAETGRVAVEAAEDVIGARLNGLHLVNDAGDTLEGGPMTDAVHETFGESLDYHRDHEAGSSDAIIWEVFETGEPLYIDDTHEYDPLGEEPPTRSVLIYPVGDHGVFIASSERANDFDETDRMLFELFSSVVTSAFDRVEREQMLRRRETRLQQQRQRLTVLNRVLRHDIRTHTDVILGTVERLERIVDDTGALETIENRCWKIVELSENARRIEQTIETSDEATTTEDLAAVAETSIEELRLSATEVDIRTTIPDEVYAHSNGLLDVALENVLRNAVEHNDSALPVVEVTVTTEPDEGDVVVRVSDNGPGMPENEREVFRHNEESQLRHSNGLGLWLVRWIVEDLGGTVEIEDRDPRGTTVSLRVPSADSA